MGAYAAVIPKWITQFIGSEPVTINGNGETSRDFCYDLTVRGGSCSPCPSCSPRRHAFTGKYVKNHCLFLDFMILISTVEVVLWGKGAR